MIVYKCDFCGDNVPAPSEIMYTGLGGQTLGYPNRITLNQFTFNGTVDSFKSYDICKACYKKIKMFLHDMELTNGNSNQ